MVFYAVTAALILRVALRMKGRERRLWQLCGVLFAFQMINVHLDLHAFPGTFGRCLAHAQGWYENRHEVQLAFLITVGIAALLILLLAIAVFHRNIAGNFLLISGVGIALGITAVKGINYHGAEQLYGGTFGAFRGADLIEVSGIILALTAAILRLSRSAR